MKKNLFLFLLLLSFYQCGNGSSSLPTLHFYSWAEYMDPSVIKDFEKKYHAKVVVDYFATNEEAITKIEQQIKLEGKTPYDVFMPSDYFVDYMKKKNLLEPVDINNMPHVKNNILDYLKNPSDPDFNYAIPYTWGTVGILYNKDKIKEDVTSWSFIFSPLKKYQSQILMIDSPKELVGIALKSLNLPFNSSSKENLAKAEEVLQKQSPYVLNYNGDMIQDSLGNGEVLMAVSWSAEAAYAINKNPSLDFVIPKEGSNLYMDEFVVLKGASQKKLAEQFIDFFYENSTQLKNWNYMHMSLPSKTGVKQLPEKVQKDKRWYPSLATLKKLDANQPLSEKTLKNIQDIYTKLRV